MRVSLCFKGFTAYNGPKNGLGIDSGGTKTDSGGPVSALYGVVWTRQGVCASRRVAIWGARRPRNLPELDQETDTETEELTAVERDSYIDDLRP